MKRHARLGLLIRAVVAMPWLVNAHAHEEARALDLRYAPPAHALTFRPLASSEQDRLARGIASASVPGLIELGVKASKDALLECQKGDYPGGGMGLLSMPLARPNAVTDHCRRF
jgi:hypothetical protein